MIAGNVVYAAGQWGILSLLAKLGSSEMLGRYALAVAVATPPAMLAHLNLRAVIATDVGRRHPFHGYLSVRLAASAVAVLAATAIALASGYSAGIAEAIILVAIALGAESVSDAYYGLMQRRERMDQVAGSMMLRAIVCVAALGGALWFTRRLAPALAALAAARLAATVLYDRPRGGAGEDRDRTRLPEQWKIFQTALPLGVALMLVSLTANIPRYAAARWLGLRELGAFAAVAAFIQVGAVTANALGQAATPRLARAFAEGDLATFHRLGRRAVLVSLGMGAAGVACAALLGPFVLTLAYRAEYAAYSGLLVGVMAAGALSYVAIILGYLLTSARSFRPQAPLLAAVAAVSAVASWLLIPKIGLAGAAAAIALSACVQIGGSLVILRRLETRCES